jgi:hypothetical protein
MSSVAFDTTKSELAEIQIGSIVFGCVVTAIFVLWLYSNGAWLHPELLTIGDILAPHRALHLRMLFDYKFFDANPQRMRIVSDLFEIIDASARPFFALLYAHPTLTVTTLLYATLVPWFTFGALRLFGLTASESLLACAVLVASPGFLSNLFVYIRPAKPLSFILLAYTVLWLARHANQSRALALAGIMAVIVVGDFTDELLYWNAFFVAASILILGGFGSWLRAILVIILPTLIFAFLLFIVLPYLYAHLGAHGARSFSFQNPTNGEFPAARMLSYFVAPNFYATGLIVAARSLAAHAGIVSLSWTSTCAALVLLIAASLGLLLTRLVKGDNAACRIAALALFGFISFTAAGTWLQWFKFPDFMTNVMSLNYYYNSPASLFVAMGVGAGLCMCRSTVARWSVGAVVTLIVFGSVTTFQSVNEIFKFRHLGPTDTAFIFEALNAPHVTPSIIVTANGVRFEKELWRYNELGHRLFGSSWETLDQIYFPRQYFEQEMSWYGPTYAVFGKRYGEALCIAFIRSNCPIQFVDKAQE